MIIAIAYWVNPVGQRVAAGPISSRIRISISCAGFRRSLHRSLHQRASHTHNTLHSCVFVPQEIRLRRVVVWRRRGVAVPQPCHVATWQGGKAAVRTQVAWKDSDNLGIGFIIVATDSIARWAAHGRERGDNRVTRVSEISLRLFRSLARSPTSAAMAGATTGSGSTALDAFDTAARSSSPTSDNMQSASGNRSRRIPHLSGNDYPPNVEKPIPGHSSKVP